MFLFKMIAHAHIFAESSQLNSLEYLFSLDHSDQNHNYRNDQKDMDKSTHGICSNYT